MSTASTRTEKRAPVTLKIKFKSSTLDQFVERYSVDISQGGIFIRTKSPLEVGTPLRFEFQLKNATPLITGEGTVVWTREYDPSRTGLAPGMGVRFDRLPPESQQVLAKILEQKKSRPSRSSRPAPVSEDAANEFVDSPTKVAPRDVIAGLADTSRETFSEDSNVPADAFEEATKVGLLDELVARTAEPEDDEDEPILTSAPRDRAPSSQPVGVATDDVTLDQQADDEPGLPAPVSGRSADDELEPVAPSDDDDDDDIVDLPAPAARKPDFPDHIPTELNLAPPPPSKSPEDHAPTDVALEGPSDEDVAAAKEKLGGPAETLMGSAPPLPDRPPVVDDDDERETRQRDASPSAPPPASKPLAATPHLMAKSDERRGPVEASSSGGSGLWIAMAVGIILLAGGGGAWYMMTQQDDTPSAERPPPQTSPVASETPPNEPEAPAEPEGVESTVTSPVEGATASLVDGDQSGPVPMTFKGLEEGETYKVTVSAPGFLPAEVEVTGGEAAEPIELEPKPRFISVTSSPEGAAVFINKRRKGRTPFELELEGALARADEYTVQLRRAGYKNVEQTIASDGDWTEEDERMIASLDLKLDRRRRVVRPKPEPEPEPEPEPKKTKASGSSDTKSSDDGGSGEPVPDWAEDKDKPKPKPKPKGGDGASEPKDTAPKTEPASGDE